MTEHYLEELIQSLTSVSDKGENIPLRYTGLQKTGGYTSAFELENTQSKQKYYLKFTDARDAEAEEIRALSKVNQIFKNEALTEPDADKRLGYIPVPRIICDDPARFNPEFANLIDKDRYQLQLQTAADGVQSEREVPAALSDRIRILLSLAKLLRTCAKNKIAYVDLKPLEHIFWKNDNGQIFITLIDWGISRNNANVVLIADDIRKFCQFMPEIIYGRKMLELQNKGKLEYPIQKEARKALLPLLSQFSFNGDLPPLIQEHALVLGDILSGSANEFRVQNRCVSIWDAIISTLNYTLQQIQIDGEEAGDLDVMVRLSENTILENKNSAAKDFSSALRARQISLFCHEAWIIPALRFTQMWYGRIDLIPHSEFDETIRFVLDQDAPAALQEFDKLSDLISQKIAQSETFPELRHRILSNLATIREVIDAWCLINGLKKETLKDDDFLSKMATSSLRVSDPALATIYQRIRSGRPATETTDVQDKSDRLPEVINEVEDQKSLALINSVQSLRQEFERTGNFMTLRNSGFFQRLNEVTAAMFSCKSTRPGKLLEVILVSILSEAEAWIDNIRPEKYFVSDEMVNSIEWLQSVSPIVCSSLLHLDGKEVQLGACLKNKLSDVYQSLFYTLAKEQSSGEPPDILAKVMQIKTLRKRLDMDNLNYIRALIDRGEFESANQIINLHYSEFPYLFDQLNNEIAGKRKEQADQKTLAIVNSVLNDLTSNDTRLETSRYLNSQQSTTLINERFFNFRNRSAQMFELQDDMGRTRQSVGELRSAQRSLKYLSIGTLITAILTVVLAVVLLVSLLAKNFNLEQNILSLSTAAAQNQTNNQMALNALQAKLSVPPTAVPTDVPTLMPTILPTPTVEQNDLILRSSENISVEESSISPADQKLENMLGKAIVFDLPVSLQIFASDTLDTASQLGQVSTKAEGLSGQLVSYSETAINIMAEFNIGRSQISVENNLTVVGGTIIRQYSTVASETTPLFTIIKDLKLSRQATECESGQKPFCHGLMSLWFDRSKIESSIK